VYKFTGGTGSINFPGPVLVSGGAVTTGTTTSTTTGTVVAPTNTTLELLIVGGGGSSGGQLAGGAGAGGMLSTSTFVSIGNRLKLSIGLAGQGPLYQSTFNDNNYYALANGADSYVQTDPAVSATQLTAYGGGKGGVDVNSPAFVSGGGSGGSGGGNASRLYSYNQPGGAIDPAQGNGGGFALQTGSSTLGGGGGGAGGAGQVGIAGKPRGSSITGSLVYYAQGGYGSGASSYTTWAAENAYYGNGGTSGPGNPGVIVIAYPSAFQAITDIPATLTYTLDIAGRLGYRVYTFTAGIGTITI
jgi:hypothetical protein